jgi:very-short-patch-repair endonuclease
MKAIEVREETLKKARYDYLVNLLSLKDTGDKYGIPPKKLSKLLGSDVRTVGEANKAARAKNPDLYRITPEMKCKISKTLKETNKTKKRLGIKKPYKKENSVERTFRKLIEKTNYIWEQYFYIDELDKNYEIDFAIPSSKLLFEINGPYHYNEDGTFTEYHLNRKKEIESCGYRIIDIDHKEIYYEDNIKDILRGICTDITFDNPINPILTYKEKETNRIVNLVINSEIDFSKLGWVTKVSKVIGIWPQHVNKWMKKNMLEFYNEKCFKKYVKERWQVSNAKGRVSGQ